LYVLQKNHLTGLLLQLIYRIPFVVSEQSTLYIDGGFEKLGRLRKSLWSYVFKRAASYHSVSHYLANNIKNKLQLAKEGVIIPNVVDSGLFFYNHEWVNSRTTFVHVSNMVYQKNVEGMLQAFAKLKKNTPDFILNLVGPMPLLITELIAELGLEKQVVCWGERNYKEVAGIMQQSDVFVFFTRFETFGCVIIEANASGLPVIVSDLPVTREVVKSNVNGLFVESENEQDLAEKLLFMKHHLHSFDPLSISLQTRNKYNYNNVGKQFSKWYTDVLAAEK
jgi:glycosyltransferase involved in cell wall biosynthesis